MASPPKQKPPLKTSRDGEGPKSTPKIDNNNYVTGTIQMKNISPRINTHDSIDRTNQSKLYFDKRGNSNNKWFTVIQNFKRVTIQSI